MNIIELLKYCRNKSEKNGYVEFDAGILEGISERQAELLAESLGHDLLMKLPDAEIAFFEWLRVEDEIVWNDLWKNDSLGNEPYIVSFRFLATLLKSPDRGFPICDLLTTDNYYFSNKHMVDKESDIFLDSVKRIFQDKKDLSLGQLLALEISAEPLDIWHFAYKYNVEIERAKDAVARLVEDNVLVHLKDAEYLAGFIEF